MSNKYTYSVPFTEEQLYQAYVVDGLNQYETASQLGVTQKVIWRALKKMGIPARKAIKRNQTRENNSSWKGGRTLVNYKTPAGYRYLSDRNDNKGYYMVRMPEHPNAGGNGYVFEHVVIALRSAGRESIDRETECVHHINFVRTDNREENLLLCLKSKHREYHGNLENLVGKLLDLGIVGFDTERGYYIR